MTISLNYVLWRAIRLMYFRSAKVLRRKVKLRVGNRGVSLSN